MSIIIIIIILIKRLFLWRRNVTKTHYKGGPATENARSPNVVHILWTRRSPCVADRTLYPVSAAEVEQQRSARYRGAILRGIRRARWKHESGQWASCAYSSITLIIILSLYFWNSLRSFYTWKQVDGRTWRYTLLVIQMNQSWLCSH